MITINLLANKKHYDKHNDHDSCEDVCMLFPPSVGDFDSDDHGDNAYAYLDDIPDEKMPIIGSLEGS